MASAHTRTVAGLAVSGAFIALTLSLVDAEVVGRAWMSISPAAVALMVLLSVLEVGVRATRWIVLLRPIAAGVTLSASFAYLSIGHLANAVLPARLGDVSRAFLAGGRLGVSRSSVLGTIAVERVADTGLLVTAAALGVAFGISGLLWAVAVAVAVAGAVVLLGAAIRFGLRLEAIGRTRVGTLVRFHGPRFLEGGRALRDPVSLILVVVTTSASFALAVAMVTVAAAATGVPLTAWQAAIVIAAVTLSTAIPAGPASIGTYEFVGVSVIAAMGVGAAPALLAIALVHAIATLVPATVGLGAMWALGVSRFLPRAAAASTPIGDEP